MSNQRAEGDTPRVEVTCCAAPRYEVTPDDYPVHCPADDMSLWNAHPRVYIPVYDVGDEARCPYCSALFVMVEAKSS